MFFSSFAARIALLKGEPPIAVMAVSQKIMNPNGDPADRCG
jgi:hypothetical protein